MKNKTLIGLSLALLIMLSGCSNGSSSVSVSTDTGSSDTGSTSEPTTDTIDPYDDDDEYTSVEDNIQELTVAGALGYIQTLQDNTRSMDRYQITGYVTSVGEITEQGTVKVMSFHIADSVDSPETLLVYNLLAEDEIMNQEIRRGAKVQIIGQLIRFVENGTVTPAIVSPVIDILESVLVDATDMILAETDSIVAGESKTLELQWLPENGRKEKVYWSSSDSEIASVDQNGKVTAIAAGEATITAECTDFTKTCTLTVTPDLTPKAVIKFDAYTGSDTPVSSTKADSVIGWLVSDGKEYLDSCTEAVNVYIQPSCMRLGNSQKAGSVTFALKNSLNVKDVAISVRRYSSDETTCNFSAAGFNGTLEYQSVTDKDSFQKITYTLNSTISAFTLSNSAKRMFIESVTFILAE